MDFDYLGDVEASVADAAEGVGGAEVAMTDKWQRARVRQQIIWAIEQDLDGGGESLMKEAFEECDDLKVVYSEMRRVIRAIKALGK